MTGDNEDRYYKTRRGNKRSGKETKSSQLSRNSFLYTVVWRLSFHKYLSIHKLLRYKLLLKIITFIDIWEQMV